VNRAFRGVALAVGLALAGGAITAAAFQGAAFLPLAAVVSIFVAFAGYAALALTDRAANIKGDAPTSFDPPSRGKR